MSRQLTQEEIGLDAEFYSQVNKWLARGDGIAVYENQDLGHYECGHRQFMSFGSKEAQFECEIKNVPLTLPDTPTKINWRYRLIGWYRGPQLEEKK